MVQDHPPALRSQFINIRGDDLSFGGSICTPGLYLFTNAVNGQITCLRAMMANDVKAQLLALRENLFPAPANCRDTLQARTARVYAFHMFGLKPDLHHGRQVAT